MEVFIYSGTAQQTMFIEAEQAQFTGDWYVEVRRDEASAEAVLRGNNAAAGNDAMFVISVPTAGSYNIWARTRDFDTFPGQRRFQLGVDGEMFPTILGDHGQNSYYWELAGTRSLTAQKHVISLKDISNYYPRCDALFLTPSSVNPNLLSMTLLRSYAVTLPKIPFRNLDSAGDLSLRFNNPNVYALAGGGSLIHTTNHGGALRFSAPSNLSYASAIVTPFPDAPMTNHFANSTISVDFRFSAPGQSFGVFSRIPSARDDSHLVEVVCDADSVAPADVLRIYGQGTDPAAMPVSGSHLLSEISYASPMVVTVPGRKLVALRFTTQTRDVFPRTVPLTATPVTQTLPGAWGTMHAFRIRSPFGSDSLYVVLTGRPPAGASAKLLLNSAPAVSKGTHPYEFFGLPLALG